MKAEFLPVQRPETQVKASGDPIYLLNLSPVEEGARQLSRPSLMRTLILLTWAPPW